MLKWAGGKGQLLPKLLSLTPLDYGNYIEPFFGGGAMFFALTPRTAVVSDANPELMLFYRALAHDYKAVLDEVDKMPVSKEAFYDIRSLDVTDGATTVRAARLLYLNKTCFNGLYRVDKRGRFNVPFGSGASRPLYDRGVVASAAVILRQAEIVCSDFRDILGERAQPGDFVFLDPPYVPVSQFADFKRYTANQFREQDHRDLAAEFRRLAEKGCYVMLTNSDHPLVHELYADFDIRTFDAARNINRDGTSRRGRDTVVTSY